ncbi:MAG: GNAT family N-acetyltransferase [Candidatus Heimdallarchaeota archaeon]|nr:GNAT family N-acetyltransferase [Candidatus Heimdallarchaeota archaeon]
MMKELSPEQFERAFPLTKQMSYNSVLYAIIEGTHSGRIWINELSNPSLALFWDMDRRFYLLGDYSNNEQNKKLQHILETIVFEHGLKNHLSQWTFHYAPLDWEEILLEMIVDYLPLKDNRLYYQFDYKDCQLLDDWQENLKPNFELLFINESFFENKNHLKHFDRILSEISYWQSREMFLQYGYGFCLVDDKTIAAWCLGEYVSPNHKKIEVGITTYPPFQKQGLATITGSAFVDYSIKKGYTVGWHCWENNIPSLKTAEKIGFKFVKKYPVLYGWYNKIDGLLVHAWNNISKSKNYRKAISFYQQVLAFQKSTSPLIKTSHLLKKVNVNLYLAACYGQLREFDQAFDFLQKAIDSGFKGLNKLQKNKLFEPLSSHPNWQNIADNKE